MNKYKYIKLLLVPFVLFVYYANITHFEHHFKADKQCQVCAASKQTKSVSHSEAFFHERVSLYTAQITQPQRVYKRASILTQVPIEFEASPLPRRYVVKALALGYFSHAPPLV